MPREFIVFNGMGQSIESPTADEMRSMLAALDDHDTEHGAAWIESDDGHVIEYSVGGTIAIGEADGIRRRYQGGASREKALELWLLLVDGRLDLIEREPWQTDEPPRPKGPTDEELERSTSARTVRSTTRSAPNERTSDVANRAAHEARFDGASSADLTRSPR